MKQVTLASNHRFFEDYDQLLDKNLKPSDPKPTVADHIRNVKEWYGYDIEIDPFGTCVKFNLTESAYTMFLLKWC